MNSSDEKDQEEKVYRKERGNASAYLAAKSSLLMTKSGTIFPTLSLKTLKTSEQNRFV